MSQLVAYIAFKGLQFSSGTYIPHHVPEMVLMHNFLRSKDFSFRVEQHLNRYTFSVSGHCRRTFFRWVGAKQKNSQEECGRRVITKIRLLQLCSGEAKTNDSRPE